MHMMKRVIASILVLTVVFAGACSDDDGGLPTGLSDQESVTADSAWLTFSIIKNKNLLTNYITSDLVNPLPVSGPNGSAISWSVSSGANGAAINPVSGTVTRGSADTDFTLSAIISRGSWTNSVVFDVTVITAASGKTVHFFNNAYGQAYMHYNKDGSGWTTSPGQAMQDDGDGWWSYSVAGANDLEFVFNNGSGTWYPGGNDNNYRSSCSEIYITNGIVYDHDPAGSRPTDSLVVLTLNLHTYQETSPLSRLNIVADVIAKVKPDFVCFQETAQHKNDSNIVDARAPYNQSGIDQIKSTNMAYLISKRLADVHGLTYNYYWSWAHYGWDVWEEGVAVMTPYAISAHGNKYISTGTTTADINSRKAVYVSATVPGIGTVNVFSAHTSWWSGGLSGQIDSLKAYVTAMETNSPVGSIICGDFNDDAGGQGYTKLVSTTGGQFNDSYYVANPRGFNSGSDMTTSWGTRIDYIFYKEGAPFIPVTSQVYFKYNSNLGGQVSDHYGVITRFKVVN